MTEKQIGFLSQAPRLQIRLRQNVCNRKVAYDVTHFAPKKWLTKSSNLCWKGIGRRPTFEVILKINEKLIKNWNELLLVGSSETNNFN